MISPENKFCANKCTRIYCINAYNLLLHRRLLIPRFRKNLVSQKLLGKKIKLTKKEKKFVHKIFIEIY